MNILRLLGKLTGIENSIKWSQSKVIIVSGPNIFGQHSIFVDPKFNVAIFLPKDDKTLHIFVGDIFNAKRWIKCDSKGNKIKDENPPKEAFQWKIKPKKICYRGTGFPSNKKVYFGKVISSKNFSQVIDEKWLDIKIKEYIKMFKNNK